MTFLLINEKGASFIDIPNTLEDINKALSWDDYWDCPTVQVRGHDYIVICADTGKMRHDKISALAYRNLIEPGEEMQEPFIVGNIIVTKFDGTDDFTDLTEDDRDILLSRLMEHRKPYLKDFNPCILIID